MTIPFPDRGTLNDAISDWFSGGTAKATVITTYGQMSAWTFESTLTDFSGLFIDRTTLGSDPTNENLSNWDTHNVLNMASMFSGATNFNSPLSNWNTSNVLYMAGMFAVATVFNQDISLWDTHNVLNMSNMFNGASVFNSPLSNWITSQVTDMASMFQGENVFNQDISLWDTHNVLNMSNMFNGASVFNSPLSNWNTINVTDMNGMFQGANVFNQDISSWDTSNVLNMASMFSGVSDFNSPLSNWNTNKVTDMNSMFASAQSFNQDISLWDTSNVTSMAGMFSGTDSEAGAINFNQDISSWDTHNVTDMSFMFYKAFAFNQDISSWNLALHPSILEMFTYSAIPTNTTINDRIWNAWSRNYSYSSTELLDAGLFTPTPPPTPPISNICFPAGTPIKTDQGLVNIELIQPNFHTINNKLIKYITKTVTLDKYLICFQPHCLGKNTPSQKTLMTNDHKIVYKGQLVSAYRFLKLSKDITQVKYSGETLYNVLLEEYGTMKVNNLTCETLHPENIIAKLYMSTFLKKVQQSGMVNDNLHTLMKF